MVISDAGVFNTFENLLRGTESDTMRNVFQTKGVRHGLGSMSVYAGLKGTKEELGLKASNVWAFTDTDLNRITQEYLDMDAATAGTEDIPLLFISFPSTKDPEWENRHPGKTTATVITVARYEWFGPWEDQRIMKRGEDYEELKNRIGRRMWEQTCRLFPQVRDRVEFFDVGSPLSNRYYLASPRGEIYGIDHHVDRFKPEAVVKLRPETSIRGLYLTGQDVLICGFAGAMYGGVVSACSVLKRNVFSDMGRLQKELKKKTKPTLEDGINGVVMNGFVSH